jgi:hypothetical protein
MVRFWAQILWIKALKASMEAALVETLILVEDSDAASGCAPSQLTGLWSCKLKEPKLCEGAYSVVMS